MGHCCGLPHWRGKSEYPYVGPMHGIDSKEGKPHRGPVWAYDPLKKEFISPIRNGVFLSDPMQTDGENPDTPFSDYSVMKMRQCMEDNLLVWDAQNRSYNKWNPDRCAYTIPVRWKGSGDPFGPSRGNCLVQVPIGSPPLGPGDTVRVLHGQTPG